MKESDSKPNNKYISGLESNKCSNEGGSGGARVGAFLFDIKRLRKELASRLACEQRPKESAGVDTELWEEAEGTVGAKGLRGQHGSTLEGQQVAGWLVQSR